MSEIKTELLFQITLDVLRISDLGNTPFGHRRIIEIAGGSFEGPKLRGRAMPGAIGKVGRDRGLRGLG